MTPETPPPPPPPLGAAQVADLLDHVIHEQVLTCVDLDALHDLEQSLTMLVGDLDGVSPDHAADLAKAMLDRALARLPDDLRRYLRAPNWPFPRCELCEGGGSPGRPL
jgi:hypothetical protein